MQDTPSNKGHKKGQAEDAYSMPASKPSPSAAGKLLASKPTPSAVRASPADTTPATFDDDIPAAPPGPSSSPAAPRQVPLLLSLRAILI